MHNMSSLCLVTLIPCYSTDSDADNNVGADGINVDSKINT